MEETTVKNGIKIGELAATYPGGVSILMKYKLDFCCGGEKIFSDVCAQRGLKEKDILGEIYAENDRNQDCIKWNEMETDALIDQIVERFHKRHREDFPVLAELSRKVEARHHDHPLCPKGLSDCLDALFQDLESHMQKEEQILFPLLRDGNPQASMPINVMRAEHDQAGEHINELRNICHNFELPEDACRSWTALGNGVVRFIDELKTHIHVENNILFTRV